MPANSAAHAPGGALAPPSGVSTEALSRIFYSLRSKDDQVRTAAGSDLSAYVSASTVELQGDALSAFNNDLNRRIFELTHSPNAHEKLGGIVAIGGYDQFCNQIGSCSASDAQLAIIPQNPSLTSKAKTTAHDSTASTSTSNPTYHATTHK